MAKVYFEKLSQLISDLEIEDEVAVQLAVIHFFNGAVLYVNETICASWSPAGLAFKLPESEAAKLIAIGKAKPLKYFERGHIKKGYAMFENPETAKKEVWKKYLQNAIEQTTNLPRPKA
jgi:TfoX/Sxy family transcriptional regulator of competence genes